MPTPRPQSFDPLTSGVDADIHTARDEPRARIAVVACPLSMGRRMDSNRFPIDMPRLIGFYMQRRLMLDDLISRRIALHEINSALADLKTSKPAQSVVIFPM